MQYLPLGCFGKLPFWPEYLEENVSYPTSRSMKNWILEGRKETGLASANVEQARPDETANRRFLFGTAGSVELTVGVIRPSRDQGGRDCPFMVHTHLPRRLYAKQYWLLPLALAPVWEALDDTWDNLSSAASPPAFKESLSSTLIPAPAPPAEVKVHYDSLQGESMAGMFDRRDGARLDAALGSLSRLVSGLKGEATSTVDLPVSRGSSASAFDAAFWIDMVNRQFLWRRFEPSVFLQEGSSASGFRVMLVFGMMRPSDYAQVMGCGDRAKEAPPAAVGEASGDAASGDAAARAVTYAEVLSRKLAAQG
jgi:hypothetical protein